MSQYKQRIKNATFVGTAANISDLLMVLAEMPRRVEFPEIIEKLSKVAFHGEMEVWVLNDFMHGTSPKIDIILRPAGGEFDPVRFLYNRVLTGTVLIDAVDGSPVVGWFTGAKKGIDEVVYWISSWTTGFPAGVRAFSVEDFPIRTKGANWVALASTSADILTISEMDRQGIAGLVERVPEVEGKLRLFVYLSRITPNSNRPYEAAAAAMVEDIHPGGFAYRDDLNEVALQVFGALNRKTRFLG